MERNPVAPNLSAHEGAQTLVSAWERLPERLPEDWSDLLVEIELRGEVPYERVAPIVSALNPERCGERSSFRFRVGRAFGYGAAVSTVSSCLRSLDSLGIRGRVRLLKTLVQRRQTQTQGSVWGPGGRSL